MDTKVKKLTEYVITMPNGQKYSTFHFSAAAVCSRFGLKRWQVKLNMKPGMEKYPDFAEYYDSMKNNRVYVIAGNYEQFKNWCRENNLSPSQAVYISSEEQLRGLHGVTIERIGTWYEHQISKSDWLIMAEAKL